MVLKKIQDDEKVLVYLGQALVCEGIVNVMNLLIGMTGSCYL